MTLPWRLRRRPARGGGPGWAAALAGLLLLALPAATSPPLSDAEALAWNLRTLYPESPEPWDRWRRDRTVQLPNGREVSRDEAYRDQPLFVGAAQHLLSSSARDDAALGAWLLGTVDPSGRGEAERVLIDALEHPDPRAAFEAAMALAVIGGEGAETALARAAEKASSEEVRAAAAWSEMEVARRRGTPARADGLRRVGAAETLAPDFRRGVSWWLGEGRGDEGRASFRTLAALGVTWVSIHTWDPLQQGRHEPVLAPRSHRFGARNLEALVENAHAAGLAVMFKPHLEMRGYRPTPEERQILRGPDPEARHQVILRIEALREHGGHNRLAMHSDADWRRWFEEYEAYILPYARDAQQAGADMFSIGRELDSSVIEREADWRRLIAKVRVEFDGPLTYSANFDSWEGIGFWDALDFIGLSAYFPLAEDADATVREMQAGWGRALPSLEAASRRWDRRVLFTEVGFPAVPSAARAPWKEEKVAADVWLQARCYEATLRALAERPWIEGAFFWLWERSSKPPFRDPSHTIVGKPATFTMARWYSAR
jgi:hypothetical protein